MGALTISQKTASVSEMPCTHMTINKIIRTESGELSCQHWQGSGIISYEKPD